MHQDQIPRMILASTSTYRKSLLNRLKIPFETIDPEIRESVKEGETPLERSLRLAYDKALAVAGKLTLATPYIVIGSDQVAHMGSQILGKPGNHEAAAEQLTICSGNWVSFTTAISLIDQTGGVRQAAECFRIRLRELDDADIDHYLRIDEPFDCAGSIKAESAGMTLLQDTDGRDFNTLIGFPLMLFRELLADSGHPLPTLGTYPGHSLSNGT